MASPPRPAPTGMRRRHIIGISLLVGLAVVLAGVVAARVLTLGPDAPAPAQFEQAVLPAAQPAPVRAADPRPATPPRTQPDPPPSPARTIASAAPRPAPAAQQQEAPSPPPRRRMASRPPWAPHPPHQRTGGRHRMGGPPHRPGLHAPQRGPRP